MESDDYHRIERAIRFIEEHRESQPELQEVADHLGLSPYHFHRLFQRWAGTTPKRFLQHLTVEHARSLLADSRPVLDAAFGAGLSGGGRLHDHFVRVEAVTPGEVRRRGRGLKIRWGIHPSPFGDAFLAATERGVTFLAFLPEPGNPDRDGAQEEALGDLAALWPEAVVRRDQAGTAELAGRVFAPWSRPGPPRPEDGELLPVHLRGTNFQLQVWRALLRIPPGSVTSYGELARIVDRPSAARAVGAAVGANPVSLLVPCHRVIRSVGTLGGYRWGVVRKRALLSREAVD